jgi:molybdate transport system substrate-binding protein
MSRALRLQLGLVAAIGLLAAACDSGKATVHGTAPPVGAGEPTAGATGDTLVFAAASLTEAFTEIGDAFMAGHPGATVRFNFASSSDLVTQITQGAEADVFASADEANMAKLTTAGGAAGEPRVFATNSLQIIVEPGNPKGISGLVDLAKPGVLYVTAGPEVPIGRYAAQVLEAAGVAPSPVSLEQNVKGIVTKVTLGEADAGIVYATDVLAAGSRASGVDIPAGLNIVATYPVVVTRAGPNPGGGQAFVDSVLSGQGQTILARYGFSTP